MLSISERYEFNVMKARLAYYDQLFGLEAVAEAIRLAVVNNGEVPRPSVDALRDVVLNGWPFGPQGKFAEEPALTASQMVRVPVVTMQPPMDGQKDAVEMNRSELMKLLKTCGVSYPITATRDDLLALYRTKMEEAA